MTYRIALLIRWRCRLQQLVDLVARRFVLSGLMPEQPHKVKLHITLMNTKFRETRFATENTSQPPARNPRSSFDASNILKAGFFLIKETQTENWISEKMQSR